MVGAGAAAGLEVDRGEPLFHGRISALVERAGVAARKEDLVLRLLGGPRALVLELTRDDDLLFLLTMQVSESEFASLKAEQSLLVEFSSFAPKFVELLSQGFGCVLDLVGLPVLRVVEANQFRQLTHLALRFQPASDEQLKAHLSGRLGVALREGARAVAQCVELEGALRAAQGELAGLADELARLRESGRALEERLARAHGEQLSRAREESLKLLAQTQAAAAEQARRQQEQADRRASELEQQLSALQAEHRRQFELRAAAEAEGQQARARGEAAERFAREGTAELAALRAQNRELDNARFELDKRCGEQALSLAAARAQLADREEALARAHAQAEDAAQRRTAAEEKAAHYKASGGKLQRKLELGVREINKGNAVIEQLQQELAAANERLRTRALAMRQQEKVLGDATAGLEAAQQAAAQAREQLAQERAAGRELRAALEQSRAKLEECNKMLESDQNVIAFLNKEINQAGRSHLLAPPPRLGEADNVEEADEQHLHLLREHGHAFSPFSPPAAKERFGKDAAAAAAAAYEWAAGDENLDLVNVLGRHVDRVDLLA
jgi:spindle assembly abnormal protein 6